MKRTPLARRTRLTARARQPHTPTRRRPTGFPPDVKAEILSRDGRACVIAVCCDGRPGSAQTVHHLENRGMGGAASTNTVTNGVAACHLDNAWVEDHPAEARASGWKRRRGQPADSPVLYPDGWHQLQPDGSRTPCTAEETA